MLVALFNKLLYSTFLSWTHVGPVVTALLLGIALRAAGVLERDPLGKSDSFGLLMLGLMALMAQAFAKAGSASLLSLVPAALLALALASLTVAAAGALAGRLLGLGAWTGLAAAAGCLVGLPLCAAMVQEAGAAVGDAGATQGPSPAAARLLPQVVIAASLMGNVLSIVLASLAGAFVR
jgi:energy-converting hydrogenase Eha subunit C